MSRITLSKAGLLQGGKVIAGSVETIDITAIDSASTPDKSIGYTSTMVDQMNQITNKLYM